MSAVWAAFGVGMLVGVLVAVIVLYIWIHVSTVRRTNRAVSSWLKHKYRCSDA